MSKKEMPVNAQPHVWKQLVNIHGRRGTAKNRVTDLTTRRGQVEKELRELGAGETPEHKDLALQLWRTNESLKKEREGIAWLADQIDEVIDKGLQGELYRPPAQMPSDEDEPEPEPEPELFQHAREEREHCGAQGGTAPKSAPGDALEVGQTYRFTSRANPERWMEARVVTIHEGTSMVSVNATAFDKDFGPKGLPGTHDVNCSAVTWVKIEAAPRSPASAMAEVAAAEGWKFPGHFVFKPDWLGAPVCRIGAADPEELRLKLCELCGADASVEILGLAAGGSVMVRAADSPNGVDQWQSVGVVSQVVSDEKAGTAGGKPAKTGRDKGPVNPQGGRKKRAAGEVTRRVGVARDRGGRSVRAEPVRVKGRSA